MLKTFVTLDCVFFLFQEPHTTLYNAGHSKNYKLAHWAPDSVVWISMLTGISVRLPQILQPQIS